MIEYVFDVEANGFLAEVTKLHCIWIEDVATGERWDFGPDRVEEGVNFLAVAVAMGHRLIGHNIIKYDVPVINKLFPGKLPAPSIDNVGKVYFDTLVATRMLWPDIRATDGTRQALPGKLKGTHKLEAWGYRMGVLKGLYEGGFEAWNPDMHAYCEQDVVVTRALLKRIHAASPPEFGLQMEHEFAFVIAQMELNGFGFDEPAAAELYTQFVKRRQELAVELQAAFPPETIVEEKIAGASNKKLGRVKGQPFTKTTVVEFNPSSRQMIGRRLQALGWEPQEFTANGQPKIDETTLASIFRPEAKLLAEHFLVEKRIGQIAEGDQAWLKLVKDGVIHGGVNPNGAVTGRCTHSRPNMSQVPKVGSPHGAECRALFRPTRKGWVQVGADLSGIELRCKAHYIAAIDGGAYAQILLLGDIHWANVLALGLATGDRDDSNLVHKIVRNAAKTFIYAYLYGAGNHKVATIIYEFALLALKDAGLPYEHLQERMFGHLNPPSDSEFASAGKKLKTRFLRRMPALAKLVENVQAKVKATGSLRALDKRKLRIRSSHSALNTLFQSAGAIIAKLATIIAFRKLHAAGFVWGRDWALMGHFHDELQVECRPEIAEQVGQIIVQAMGEAGEAFAFRLPITGEYRVGKNWCDCH